MSIFFCARCGGLRDSDDGCAEYGSKGTELICVDCMDDLDDEASNDIPEDLSDVEPWT